MTFNAGAVSFFGFIEQVLKRRPGPYSDVPRPIYRGANPRRDPRTRGGMWSEAALRDAELSRMADFEASLTPGLPPLHGLAVNASSGSNQAWEGSVSVVGGGQVNSGNGNKLTELPLVSWKDRGGMVVDFTLYHNSQGGYNDELGKGWTWTYDIYVSEGQSSAIVHWGNGTCIPFSGGGGPAMSAFMPMNALWASLSPGGRGTVSKVNRGEGEKAFSNPQPPAPSPTPTPPSFSPSAKTREGLVDTTYTAPAGIYDTLVKKTNGTWELTQKDGTVYRFNTGGYCHQIEDRNGNQINLTLDEDNYCTRVTGPSGRYIDITVDGSNNFTQIEDPLGRVWEFTLSSDTLTNVEWPTVNSTTYSDAYTYDASGRILTHTDKRGKVWTFTYNSDGSLATAKTPLNHTTSYSYTTSATTITFPGSQTNVHNYSSGKLASTVDAGSYSESYTWNGSNQMTQRVDRRGKTWTYTYDSKGNLLTLTNPLSKVWTYTYSADNDLLTEEDPLENVTTYTYDEYGNLETVEDPLERVTTNTYDGYGQLLTTENPEEEVTTFTYDTDGNLTSVEDPLEHAVTMTYGDLGWLETVTDANGNTETFSYDEWGRKELVTHEDDTDVQFEYNANSQLTAVTNERGKTTSYVYDDSGRLTSVTNAKSETESYAYNSNGWRTSVTNGRGKTRTYTFTSRGEVYTLTLPDSSVETWTYSGNGQVSAYTNPLSQTISYTFDNASQQTGVDYPTGTDTSFSYDDAGRMTAMVDSTGTTSWTYDDAGQVTAFDPPQGLVEYTYDGAGRRLTMDHDGVGVTDYAYDAAGRLTSLTNAYDEVTEFTYDAGNRLTRKDFHNGTYEATSYDTRNRVTEILLKNSSNSTLRTQSWTYDDGSNVATMTQGGVTTTFGYDDIDQLTSESPSGYSASYTYDANGNRATKTLGGVTENYTYDDADKLDYIQVSGNTTKDYSYDAAGRTTSVAVTGVGTTTLAYDYKGRVTTITYPSTATNTFTYNGLDTRVGKVDSGGTSTYLRDGAGVTAPVLSDASAVYTPSISERRSSTTTYYHNGFKNAESQTIANETVSATQTFDAFGLADTSSGTWKGPFAYGGPHGYQSDADSGLKLLGHRYYDASTGRFLTRDPAKEGRNWYAYCDGNPVRFTDPTGLLSWSDVGNGLLTAGAALVSGASEGLVEAVTMTSPLYMLTGPPISGWDGGSYKDDPGFSESKISWMVAGAALSLADGLALFGGGTTGGGGLLGGALERMGACFAAGTQVAMADGSTKAIEEIQVGDKVLTRDEDADSDSPTHAGTVVRTFVRQSETLVLRFGNGSVVETTAEHPFFVKGRGFVPAISLKVGELIGESSSGSIVCEALKIGAERTVYNFEVALAHTYFVKCASTSLWVHNACSRPSRMNRDPNKPPGIRVDNGDPNVPPGTDHIHNGGGPTWHNNGDGTGAVGHSGAVGPHPRDWTNAVKDWIEGHGWPRPQ